MTAEFLLAFATRVRPVVRHRTPILYPIVRLLIQWICPRKPKQAIDLIAEYNGGRIHVNTGWSLERHILLAGVYEPVISNIVQRALKAGGTALDIGANIGAHTLVMARTVGAQGHIVAIEPHPVVAARLRDNLDLNGIAHVNVLEAAFSDQDGKTRFYGFDPNAPKKGISSLEPDDRARVPIEVETLCGSTFMHRFPLESLDLVKVDVEGAEQRVLSEIQPLIREHQPVVVFEHHKPHWDKFGHTIDSVLALFDGLSYTTYIVDRGRVVPMHPSVPHECDILALPENTTFVLE